MASLASFSSLSRPISCMVPREMVSLITAQVSRSRFVRIREVSLRDDLQKYDKALPIEARVHLFTLFAQCGFKSIQYGSYVTLKSMKDTPDLYKQLPVFDDVEYNALVPNIVGLNKALEVRDLKKRMSVSVFTGACETFVKKNINKTIADSLEGFVPVIASAKAKDIDVDGYISCVCDDVDRKEISPLIVADLTFKKLKMGIIKVILSDTRGVGTAKQIAALFACIKEQCASHNLEWNDVKKQLSLHLHGPDLERIDAALDAGITPLLESSVMSTGGCPVIKEAKGNNNSVGLIRHLHKRNYETGIDVDLLQHTSFVFLKYMQDYNLI